MTERRLNLLSEFLKKFVSKGKIVLRSKVSNCADSFRLNFALGFKSVF